MIKRLYVTILTLLLSQYGLAADLTVTDATVTKVQVFETLDDSVKVWLHLNGNAQVGPNPDNTSVNCELWTYDKAVYSTALAALLSAKLVTVRYIDDGQGTYWCLVKDLAITPS